jgi:hypothetical protein
MKALLLTCGRSEGAFAQMARVSGVAARIMPVDIYSLDTQPLEEFRALLIGMHVDQRFLAARGRRLDQFLERGNTVTVSGQIAHPFLRGLAPFQPLRDYRVPDLMVRREAAHPVWDGVVEDELTFRRGVAGFYGRGWHQPPDGATVIHSIGADRRPVDFVYRVGAGRVLFHGGNDLWQYAGATDTTGRIVPQLLDWLFPKEMQS